MNRLSFLLIAAVLFGMSATPAQAQIGRGRLLKKIRDDIFGTPEERAREEAARRKAEQQKRAEAQRRKQLEAQRRSQSGRQPTPARPNQANSKRPTPAQSASRASYQSALAPPREPVANRSQPKRVGFGFKFKEQSNKLIVTKVDKDGNAEEAGFKRGDQIVGIGGVDVDNEDSFNEIADILNPGDTIEIAFKRGGQVDDVLIAYGSAPEIDNAQDIGQDERDSSSSRRSDFAPPRNVPNNSGSSVLNRTDPMVREIDRLTQTVAEQRRVIEQLQSQVRSLQRSSSQQTAPPAATGKSVLQGGPTFNGPGR